MAKYLTFEQRLIKRERRRSFSLFIILFLGLYYFINTFIYTVYVLENDTMKPLISKKNLLIFSANNFFSSQDYNIGELVLYHDENTTLNFFLKFLLDFFLISKIFSLNENVKISRVVAKEGDLVFFNDKKVHTISLKDSQNYLNGRVITENIFKKFIVNESFNFLKINKDFVFVLNDNLEYISDSRSFGILPIKNIKYRILYFYEN